MFLLIPLSLHVPIACQLELGINCLPWKKQMKWRFGDLSSCVRILCDLQEASNLPLKHSLALRFLSNLSQFSMDWWNRQILPFSSDYKERAGLLTYWWYYQMIDMINIVMLMNMDCDKVCVHCLVFHPTLHWLDQPPFCNKQTVKNKGNTKRLIAGEVAE